MSPSGRASQYLQYLAAVVFLAGAAWDAIPGPLLAKVGVAGILVVLALDSRFGPAARALRLRNAAIELIPTASAVIDLDTTLVIELDVLRPAAEVLRDVCHIDGASLLVLVPAEGGLRPRFAEGLPSHERSTFVLSAAGHIGDLVSGSARRPVGERSGKTRNRSPGSSRAASERVPIGRRLSDLRSVDPSRRTCRPSR